MENVVEQLKIFITQENQKLKYELKQELKQELRQELKQDIKETTDNLRKELRQDIKVTSNNSNEEMIARLFVLENDLGTKIDIIYDYVMLQKEIFGEKFENIRNLDKRMEINEMRNLDHEKRISILERKQS